MGDLVLRISTLIQRGFLCQRCGCEIDGDLTGEPRACKLCAELDAANAREDQPAVQPVRRQYAARP